MIKWILIAIAIAVGFAIFSGNMGGARDATTNYNKLLTGKPSSGQ